MRNLNDKGNLMVGRVDLLGRNRDIIDLDDLYRLRKLFKAKIKGQIRKAMPQLFKLNYTERDLQKIYTEAYDRYGK